MRAESINMKLFREAWNAQGLCFSCKEHRPVAPGRKRCEVCLAKNNDYTRGRYLRYSAEGRCVNCGKPMDAEPNGSYCVACLEKQRVRMNRYRARKKGALE